jgi:hypothetical protein
MIKHNEIHLISLNYVHNGITTVHMFTDMRKLCEIYTVDTQPLLDGNITVWTVLKSLLNFIYYTSLMLD